jgi:hypothetical protein
MTGEGQNRAYLGHDRDSGMSSKNKDMFLKKVMKLPVGWGKKQ